ncbi:phage tail-collar fiber domain-containing protein [Vibrio algicola]|uniref:Phage tail fibre protein N-terminal domain-containing protein n=1 Tax=Vibrio algicola TaxID=2662262 RepID=A0A5Q0TD05_9VIBR|nr:phage tail protein [Vibrio algicola]
MSQAAIPFSFESYLQAKLTAGQSVDLNRIVLANIPNLDHTIPIDRSEALPPANQIVHEQDVDQTGKVNLNAVVYSIVMDTTVGDFDFNAMYLIDKNERTAVGMIVHKELESKIKTDNTSGTQGNSLVKSMLMQFDGAAAATNITVDAQTWQIDYSARLKGIDEDHRLTNLDFYGHDAFASDAFEVTRNGSTSQYFVNSGVGYIGGLRVELSGDQTLTITTKPSAIYAIANRQGSALSAFENVIDLQVSDSALSDYTQNGVDYYVAKIADIESDGTVTDARAKSLSQAKFDDIQQQIDDLNTALNNTNTHVQSVDDELEAHKVASDPHSQYAKRNELLRALAFTPVFNAGVGYVPNPDFVAPSVGQKCYVSEYETAWSLIQNFTNLIDEATKAASITDGSKTYAGWWGYGADETGAYFTTPNKPQYMHDKAAGVYGSAGEFKEDHVQNIEGNINIRGFNEFGTLVSGGTGALRYKSGANTNNTSAQSDIGTQSNVYFDASLSARTDTFTDIMGAFLDSFIWLPKGVF